MSSQNSESGRRRRSRLRVRLPAKLITRSETRNAILEDLSLHGARVATPDPLRQGCEVVLEWGRFEAFGEVVWYSNGRCGVSFFDMIRPEVLLATRDLDDAARLPEDKELARRTAQQWVQGKTRL